MGRFSVIIYFLLPAPDQIFFLISLLSHPNFPEWLRTSFFKTPLQYLGFLIDPWKFKTKHSLTLKKLHKIVWHSSEILRPKTKILEILHDFFLIKPGNTTVWCWCFPINVIIEILFFNVYINRETSAPEEKYFAPLDTLSSQLILSSSSKFFLQGLTKNNLEFENIFKHVVV